VGLVVLWLGWPIASSAQAPSTVDILGAAGRYVTQLARELDGVVIAEDYLQQSQAMTVQAKRLRSDLAFMADEVFGWIEFRDTFDVDGKPVPDRQARVVDLFSHPSAASLDQARRIVKEGARFNLAAVGVSFDRTINFPMAALAYLRPRTQPRSVFTRDTYETVGGVRTAVVSFKETASPRVIATPDNAPATGRFWIDPLTGQVRRTLLAITSRNGPTLAVASIRVDYAEASSVQLWLPKVMEENYLLSNESTGTLIANLTGRASYSNYRKFNVAVSEQQAP
jgi:hypothetical protein